MGAKIIISTQKADEIMSGLNQIKLSRAFKLAELEEGDYFYLDAIRE